MERLKKAIESSKIMEAKDDIMAVVKTAVEEFLSGGKQPALYNTVADKADHGNMSDSDYSMEVDRATAKIRNAVRAVK